MPAGDKEAKKRGQKESYSWLAVGFRWVFKWQSVSALFQLVQRCCLGKHSMGKESDVVCGDRLVMSAMGRERDLKPQT